jgi:hypothetical protein
MRDVSRQYRVFISYSQPDRALVEELDQILSTAGLKPLWDKHIAGGAEFSARIQSFITNAHVFLAFLTPAAVNRPWLNQEAGFAAALGKPILPVTLGPDPEGMLARLEAIRLREDLTDAIEKLPPKIFAQLVDTSSKSVTYECTDDNPRRAEMLAEYADSVSALDEYGMVRQRASLTSFHLPNRGPTHAIWKKYYPTEARFLFEKLRGERIALEKHARKAGCRLILDPVEFLGIVYKRYGRAGIRERINELLVFLADGSVKDVAVAINNDSKRYSSLTLVGDWFLSEAVSSAISANRATALKEAVFTRHQQTVWQAVADFDEQMKELWAAKGWAESSSRSEAISYLQKGLRMYGRDRAEAGSPL